MILVFSTSFSADSIEIDEVEDWPMSSQIAFHVFRRDPTRWEFISKWNLSLVGNVQSIFFVWMRRVEIAEWKSNLNDEHRNWFFLQCFQQLLIGWAFTNFTSWKIIEQILIFPRFYFHEKSLQKKIHWKSSNLSKNMSQAQQISIVLDSLQVPHQIALL